MKMLEDDQQSVQVAWWGKRFGFTGPNAFPWLVIMILLAGGGYLVYFSLGNWGTPFDIGKKMAEHQESMKQGHESIIGNLEELIYVNSVCMNPKLAQECANLRLAMPDSLRKKLRND